jgi:acyl-CoA thioester hydrolase
MDTNLAAPDLSAPFDRHRARVLPEWIDYNGHMNVAFYMYAFDQATETLCIELGCAADYVRQRQGMCFTLETHITYDREVALGDPLRITSQILDWDAKRIHFFHHMYHAGQDYLAATNEQIMLHVGYESRRSAPWADDVAARMAAMGRAHATLPRPQQAGRVISLLRK